MKRLIFLFLIIFPFLSFSGVKFYGGVTEDPDGDLISGVNVTLIGPNLSTTTGTPKPDPNNPGEYINFEINNVPCFSNFFVKCSKSGYINTYWGPMGVGSHDTKEENPIFTQNFHTGTIHGGTAPSHQSGKADIIGMVEGEDGEGVSGVVISAKYLDTGQDAGTIKYFGEDPLLPGNYSSTQSNGIFCIYNVDPGRPILITGTKSGYKFNQWITIGYSDSITLAGLEQVNNYINVSGSVKDENEKGVDGVNISIYRTNISTTSGQNGVFNLNVPPFSIIVVKMTKSGYKDTYMSGMTEEGNTEDAGLLIISNTFYNQSLNQIGKTHTSGKGDIIGVIGEIEGIVVKLYDYQGNQVNLSGKLFYMNENRQFDTNLNSTSSNGIFLIINLDPGLYFIKGEKEGIEFPVNVVGVFSDGITIYESGVRFPVLHIWAGEQNQLPSQIPSNAKNVEILRFNLWREDESIRVETMIFTAKGTGNISNSISSARLYYRPNWTDWVLIGNGTISGNKIIFSNLNLFVSETNDFAKNLSLVFDFNGNAQVGETFGVDIVSGSDIVAYGVDKQYPAKIEGLPISGKLTTIVQPQGPNKPINLRPTNGDIYIDGTNYLLWASDFDPGNQIFAASQWQIRRYDQTYENPTYDSGETLPTNSIQTPIQLDEVTTYYWRVRYKNGDGIWSEWSDETWFTTMKSGAYFPPNKPTNISPEDGATDIDPANCILSSSDFSPKTQDTHIASQWQIGEGEIIVFDSGFDTNNKTSIKIPPNILSYNKTYWWRVRHFGENSGFSEWSDETSFKTKEAQKGDINKDGGIDILDVILCLRQAIGLDPQNLSSADMNEDGEVDILDVILILRKAIGLDPV